MLSQNTTELMSAMKSEPRTVRGLVLAAFALAVLMFSPSARAATVLFDNFEGYSPGTEIAGQGGWYARIPGQAAIIVSPGNGLTSSVLDGGIRTGDGRYIDENLPFVFHSLPGPFGATSITRLSAEAYAFSTYNSHNAGVAFSSPDLELIFYWYILNGNSSGGLRWSFASLGHGEIGHYSGGFDQAVKLEIVVDVPVGEIYGRNVHEGGSFETPHVAITSSDLASLTEVAIFQDFRDSAYLGVEIDSVRVVTGLAGEAPVCW